MMRLLEAKKSLSEKLSREPTIEEWAGAVSQSQSELAQTIRIGQRAIAEDGECKPKFGSSNCQEVSASRTRITRFDTRRNNWVTAGSREV